MTAAPRSAEATLRQCVGATGATIDIAEAALACAAMERPGLDLAPYRAHLAAVARDMTAVEAAEPPALLADVLAERHGYRGDRDSYDDLDNADLARVIDRRRGLPVALAILWMHAARSRGWDCVGLNTPNHFVIQLDARGAWELTLGNGARVRLGRQDVDARLERFISIASPVVAARATEVNYVDLRYSNGFSIGWNAPTRVAHDAQDAKPDA